MDYSWRPFTPDLYDLGKAIVHNLLDQSTWSLGFAYGAYFILEEDCKTILSILIVNLIAPDVQVQPPNMALFSKIGILSCPSYS